MAGKSDAGGQQQQDYPAIFVSNLQWWTSDIDLETECSKYGKVLNIRFIEDKSCGKSRGMAIVDMDTQEAVQACIDQMNGKDINGRPCKVSRQMAKYQQQQQQPHPGAGRGMMPGRGMVMGGRGRGRGDMDMSDASHQMGGWGAMPMPQGGMPGVSKYIYIYRKYSLYISSDYFCFIIRRHARWVPSTSTSRLI